MPRGMAETEGWDWVPGRGVQWVLMGDRGIKRHVYGERLSKLLEVPHISMGTLVRQELHPRSSLYKQVLSSLFFFLSHIKVPIFLERLRLCLAGLCIMCLHFIWEIKRGLGNLMLFECNLRLPLVTVTLKKHCIIANSNGPTFLAKNSIFLPISNENT